jgi:tight adherence protein C
MLLAPLLGAACGAGIWTAVSALRPPRASLAEQIRPRPAAPAPPVDQPPPQREGWAARLGRPLVPALRAAGLPGARAAADLVALDWPVERLLAEKAAAALAGATAALLLGLASAAAGGSLVMPALLTVLLAAAGFYTPDLVLRAKATAWRGEVRHALSTLLDITAIALSGGAGVEQALRDASTAGHGPAFAAFHRALREAEITRTPPWGRLKALGERLGVDELDELAGSIALAGSEGARVKTSLATKAASLRAHLLAEAETDASSATERMSLPVVVLFAGFLLFLGYPALAQVMYGL